MLRRLLSLLLAASRVEPNRDSIPFVSIRLAPAVADTAVA